MSNKDLIITVIAGIGLWYIWKNIDEKDKLEKKEQKISYLQSLINLQDLDKIMTLNSEDFTMLLALMSVDQAAQMIDHKHAYEEHLERETEEKKRLEKIEKERKMVERERIRHEQEIEQKRKRQVWLTELALAFDINSIKCLSITDYNDLTYYLDTLQTLAANTARTNYQTELRLKREADVLHAETELLITERKLINLQRERERREEIRLMRNQEQLRNNEYEYQKGYNRGMVDGMSGNHIDNSWDLMFINYEYKQGYETGYRKSKPLPILQKTIKQTKEITKKIDQNVDSASREFKKIAAQVEKLNENIDKVTEEQIQEIVTVPIAPPMAGLYDYVEQPETESESESESESEKKFQDIEKQMNMMDAMMHN